MDSNSMVIRTFALGKRFGQTDALQDINLEVPPNTIYGFLGPNGAGKNTLIKTLLGLLRPTAGGGTVFGHDIASDSVSIRERIGYLSQQPRFIDSMSARQNLVFTARFYYSGPEEKIDARCDEMLALVGLTKIADRPIRNYSGGERQRLGIALAQVNYPDLLILDEPASALDPLGRQEVLQVMERLRSHSTIFYSTHILDDVQRVSDLVAILNRGRLVASGPIEQILNGREGASYTFTVQGRPPGVKERLSLLPWVTHLNEFSSNGNSTWQVGVEDEAAAEAQLLRTVLADEQVIVTAFNRKKFELEEVFIDIIKGDQDGRTL